MKITLETHGGLAAGINMQMPPAVIDLDQMPKADADAIRQLVADAQASAPSTRGTGQAADAMSYTITIDDDGEYQVLRQSDVTMTPAFSALLDRISATR
jgi:hypothetical protein